MCSWLPRVNARRPSSPPRPIHSCHQPRLLCHLCHLSALAATCHHRGTGRCPRALPCPTTACPPAFRLPEERAPAAPHPRPRAPLYPQGWAYCTPGAPHKALGPPGEQARNPWAPRAWPPAPLRGDLPHPAAALRAFPQAKDCFLNKSKKLRFLLGKFILSHFISFPPIFSPNNVIK